MKNNTSKPVGLSFFSGAMGLDLGLEQAGIHVALACEIDKTCRATIKTNRPDLPLLDDIWKYSADDIRELSGIARGADIDLIAGGPPCQAFSTAGNRKGFEDVRGNVFLKYIDLIIELKPRYAVIENVRGLLSAPLKHVPHSSRCEDWMPTSRELPGGALLFVLNKLRKAGYGVSFNLYNAANYGVPQKRERVVVICSRDGRRLPYLPPTHSEDSSWGLLPWVSFKSAVSGLVSCTHVDFPEKRLRYYRKLGPGQYWKDLPEELQKEALGKSYYSGGGKTGFLRRLDWDAPCCTLVTSPNMPATDICHPEEDRPLSIEEYKRVQQFPDEWQVCGNLKSQYKQVGNAVPLGLGKAIGQLIIDDMAGKKINSIAGFNYSRYKNTDDISWESNVVEKHKTSSVRSMS